MGEVRSPVFPGNSGLSPSVMFKSGQRSSGVALTTQSRSHLVSGGSWGVLAYRRWNGRLRRK